MRKMKRKKEIKEKIVEATTKHYEMIDSNGYYYWEGYRDALLWLVEDEEK